MIYEVIDYKNENPALFTWIKKYEKSEDKDIWVKCEVDMGGDRVVECSLVSFGGVTNAEWLQVNEIEKLDDGRMLVMNKFTVMIQIEGIEY